MKELQALSNPSADPGYEHYHIWINEKERIASFHKIRNWKAVELLTRESFHSYLNELISCSYRFQ